MKKTMITTACLATVLCAHARYATVTFRTLEGEEYRVETDGLQISTAPGVVRATGKSTSAEIKSAGRISVKFTDEYDGISLVSPTPEGPVTVFGADGMECGTFNSVDAAAEAVGTGLYILRRSDGSIVKTILR